VGKGPALTMWANHMLPVIFGVLGILVFVILDFYSKIRDGRLDPRDYQYQQLLAAHGIQSSMSRRGNCWDNAARERFSSGSRRCANPERLDGGAKRI
jgi:hypothetical protein